MTGSPFHPRVAVVGNPKPQSRTHAAAVWLATQLAGSEPDLVVDLADLGPALLDWSDPQVVELVGQVGAADLDDLVVAVGRLDHLAPFPHRV